MSEIWAAAIGAVVSAGVNYGVQSMNQPSFGGAKPPKFKPIDIGSLKGEVFKQNVLGYDLADAAMAKRFPGLVTGRKAEISDAYKQLTGPLDPSVQNAFATRAIESSLDSTGGGNPLASLGGIGSASRNQVGVNIANATLGKQDYDRSNFLNLLSAPQSQPRQAVMSPEDAVNLSIGNTQGENSYNQQLYAFNTQKKATEDSGGGF